jgi:hypothetical protein
LRINTLIGLLVFIFLYSCKDENALSSFRQDSFRKSYKLNNGNIYKNDSLFLGHPTLIRFHPDSFLVIEEKDCHRFIKIVDLKNNCVQELIPVGRGPGEMLVSWGIEIKNKEIYAFCGQLHKIIKLTQNVGRKFIISDEFFIDESQTLKTFPLTSNSFVCLSNYGCDYRLTFLNCYGRIKKRMGDYPNFKSENQLKANNDIFYSSISGSADGKRIVLACAKTDIIEIYDTISGLQKRFQGPLGIKLTAYKTYVGKGYLIHTEPSYMTYRNIVASDNEFIVGFIGYRFKKDKPPLLSDSYLKQLFCFDWNGNPLKIIDLPEPIISFDIDWKNKILYTISWKGENPEIISYTLQSVF